MQSPGVARRGLRAAEANEYDAAPRVVADTVRWLNTHEARWRDTDGLFKDHTANTQGVKYLGLRYDKLARTAHPASASLLDDCTDAAVVTGVLKAYLMGVKEPVLPLRTQRQLLLVPLQTAPLSRQLAEVRAVLRELPPPAFATAALLLPLLQRVAAVSASFAVRGARIGNGCPGTSAQLAALLSPMLLRRRVQEAPRSAEETRRSNAVVELLILHAASLLSSPAAVAAAPKVNSVKVSSPPPMCTSPPPHRRWSPGKHATVEHMEHVDSVLDACVGAALLGDAGAANDVTTEVDRVVGGLMGHVYTTPIATMAPEAVAAEKSVLKRKLRAFDSYFMAHTGTKPTRADKEHLRRLYIRYYKLKCTVVKHAGALPAKAQEQRAGGAVGGPRAVRVPLGERTGVNGSLQQKSPLVL